MQDTPLQDSAFIPASQSLPEITVKAVILAIILTVVLAAANAYLGLKVGLTVSASIPAAVISMGLLRLFRHSNVLENNIVQTAASAGEALVAGLAFVIPALIIFHFWETFNYTEIVVIGLVGGILGVLFSIPLRRVLLAERTLRFPEGTAIGNVLKAGASSGKNMKYLVSGGLIGGAISFLQNGLEVLSGSVQYWFRAGSAVIGFGSGFDAALIAAGYIIGLNVGLAILAGIVVAWVIGIPYFSYTSGVAASGDPVGMAMDIWHSHLRYIGVGMMMIGGLWTLVTFLRPMAEGIRASFISLATIRKKGASAIARTEKDMPINYVTCAIVLLSIPVFILLWHYTSPAHLSIGQPLRVSAVLIGTAYAIVAGFFFSAICGYFTGLVGSSANPLSGMTISALIIISLLLLVILRYEMNFGSDHVAALNTSAFAIIIGAIIASAAAITNDTIQDLKAGQMVGATPWKQQLMLMLGVVIAAFVIPEILNLLFNAYGIGGVFPHPGMDPKQMLSAPQATLMAALVRGIFGHHLPWAMIYTGFTLAIICIIIDIVLKKSHHRLPVLAVSIGVYLPLEASVPLVIGAILNGILERKHLDHDAKQRGLILASGLVAGAALMGVILAIPFAIAKSSDVLKIVSENFTPIANGLGIMVTIILLCWMYKVVKKG